MLTPVVAYLGKMEQLTDAGSSLGGQSGNPPEAPKWSTSTRWTTNPSPWKKRLCPLTPPLFFPSHFLEGYGEGTCFLTPVSLISGFSKFKSADISHRSQTEPNNFFLRQVFRAGWPITLDPSCLSLPRAVIKGVCHHDQVQVLTIRWHSLFIHDSGLINLCS